MIANIYYANENAQKEYDWYVDALHIFGVVNFNTRCFAFYFTEIVVQ